MLNRWVAVTHKKKKKRSFTVNTFHSQRGMPGWPTLCITFSKSPGFITLQTFCHTTLKFSTDVISGNCVRPCSYKATVICRMKVPWYVDREL